MQMAFACYHWPSAAALIQLSVSGPLKAADHTLQADSCSCSVCSLHRYPKSASLLTWHCPEIKLWHFPLLLKQKQFMLAKPSLPAGVQASDLLESALANFTAARHGIATLAQSSTQSQLLTEEKVCSDLNADACTLVMYLCICGCLLLECKNA
jgi:hypothetical protein